MNAETAASFTEAFREHREAFGVPIQLEDTDLLAVVHEVDVTRELVEGGFAESGEVEAKIMASELPLGAEKGRPAIYQGRRYRVASIASDPARPILAIRLRPVRGR